jgi:DNA-binding NtrC family response regulator
MPATLPDRLTGESGMKILIVDDAQFLGAGLQRALRAAGFESICAGSAKIALQLLERHEIGLVLTDLRMPEMSGEELLVILRETRPDLRCIVMTGYATREVIQNVAQMPNVAGILVKPLEYNRLFATLARALGRTSPPLTSSAGHSNP